MKTLGRIVFSLLLIIAATTAIPVAYTQATHPGPEVDLRDITVVGGQGKDNHVWAVPGEPWTVYASLYTPALRDWLSKQSAGTVVSIDVSSSEDVPGFGVKSRVSAESRFESAYNAAEERDFGHFCASHHLILSLPTQAF
jgi:hypothetical protein